MLDAAPADSTDFFEDVNRERERIELEAEIEYDGYLTSVMRGDMPDPASVAAVLVKLGKSQTDWPADIERKRRRIAAASALAKLPAAEAEREAIVIEGRKEAERFAPFVAAHESVMLAITVRERNSRQVLNDASTAEATLRETARPSLKKKLHELGKRHMQLGNKAGQIRDVLAEKKDGVRIWTNALKDQELSALRRREANQNVSNFQHYVEKFTRELAAVDAQIAEIEAESATVMLAILTP